MEIKQDTIVAINYTLKLEDGSIIDQSEDGAPLEFLAGRGRLISGLEKDLVGKKPGDKFQSICKPEEAYGNPIPDLKVSVPKSQFDTNVEIQVGMQFQAGNGQIVTVKEVKDDEVVIDANHPLAGETLYFDIEVVSVREATPEEVDEVLHPKCSGSCGSCCGGCGDEGGCGCEE